MTIITLVRRPRTLALLALLAPAVAHAQLGGFIKRAIGEKVAEKVTEKVTQKTDSAAGTIVPGGRAGRMRMTPGMPMASITLTPDTLDQALRGLDVMAHAFARRDSIGALGNEAGRRVGELSTANGDQNRIWQEKASVVRACREEVFLAIATQRGKDVQLRAATDPAFKRRFIEGQVKFGQAIAEASAKGDTLAIQRLTAEYNRQVLGQGVDFRKDTVAATSKCGAALRRPSNLALEDSLRRESDRLTGLRRDVENAARDDAIAKSGLPAERFDAARERIELWYRGRRSGRAGAITPPEEEALAAQLPRVERIMRALGVQG